MHFVRHRVSGPVETGFLIDEKYTMSEIGLSLFKKLGELSIQVGDIAVFSNFPAGMTRATKTVAIGLMLKMVSRIALVL